MAPGGPRQTTINGGSAAAQEDELEAAGKEAPPTMEARKDELRQLVEELYQAGCRLETARELRAEAREADLREGLVQRSYQLLRLEAAVLIAERHCDEADVDARIETEAALARRLRLVKQMAEDAARCGDRLREASEGAATTPRPSLMSSLVPAPGDRIIGGSSGIDSESDASDAEEQHAGPNYKNNGGSANTARHHQQVGQRRIDKVRSAYRETEVGKAFWRANSVVAEWASRAALQRIIKGPVATARKKRSAELALIDAQSGLSHAVAKLEQASQGLRDTAVMVTSRCCEMNTYLAQQDAAALSPSGHTNWLRPTWPEPIATAVNVESTRPTADKAEAAVAKGASAGLKTSLNAVAGLKSSLRNIGGGGDKGAGKNSDRGGGDDADSASAAMLAWQQPQPGDPAELIISNQFRTVVSAAAEHLKSASEDAAWRAAQIRGAFLRHRASLEGLRWQRERHHDRANLLMQMGRNLSKHGTAAEHLIGAGRSNADRVQAVVDAAATALRRLDDDAPGGSGDNANSPSAISSLSDHRRNKLRQALTRIQHDGAGLRSACIDGTAFGQRKLNEIRGAQQRVSERATAALDKVRDLAAQTNDIKDDLTGMDHQRLQGEAVAAEGRGLATLRALLQSQQLVLDHFGAAALPGFASQLGAAQANANLLVFAALGNPVGPAAGAAGAAGASSPTVTSVAVAATVGGAATAGDEGCNATPPPVGPAAVDVLVEQAYDSALTVTAKFLRMQEERSDEGNGEEKGGGAAHAGKGRSKEGDGDDKEPPVVRMADIRRARRKLVRLEEAIKTETFGPTLKKLRDDIKATAARLVHLTQLRKKQQAEKAEVTRLMGIARVEAAATLTETEDEASSKATTRRSGDKVVDDLEDKLNSVLRGANAAGTSRQQGNGSGEGGGGPAIDQQEIFAFLDRDNDGKVDADDLGAALTDLGIITDLAAIAGADAGATADDATLGDATTDAGAIDAIDGGADDTDADDTDVDDDDDDEEEEDEAKDDADDNKQDADGEVKKEKDTTTGEEPSGVSEGEQKDNLGDIARSTGEEGNTDSPSDPQQKGKKKKPKKQKKAKGKRSRKAKKGKGMKGAVKRLFARIVKKSKPKNNQQSKDKGGISRIVEVVKEAVDEAEMHSWYGGPALPHQIPVPPEVEAVMAEVVAALETEAGEVAAAAGDSTVAVGAGTNEGEVVEEAAQNMSDGGTIIAKDDAAEDEEEVVLTAEDFRAYAQDEVQLVDLGGFAERATDVQLRWRRLLQGRLMLNEDDWYEERREAAQNAMMDRFCVAFKYKLATTSPVDPAKKKKQKKQKGGDAEGDGDADGERDSGGNDGGNNSSGMTLAVALQHRAKVPRKKKKAKAGGKSGPSSSPSAAAAGTVEEPGEATRRAGGSPTAAGAGATRKTLVSRGGSKRSGKAAAAAATGTAARTGRRGGGSRKGARKKKGGSSDATKAAALFIDPSTICIEQANFLSLCMERFKLGDGFDGETVSVVGFKEGFTEDDVLDVFGGLHDGVSTPRVAWHDDVQAFLRNGPSPDLEAAGRHRRAAEAAYEELRQQQAKKAADQLSQRAEEKARSDAKAQLEQRKRKAEADIQAAKEKAAAEAKRREEDEARRKREEEEEAKRQEALAEVRVVFEAERRGLKSVRRRLKDAKADLDKVAKLRQRRMGAAKYEEEQLLARQEATKVKIANAKMRVSQLRHDLAVANSIGGAAYELRNASAASKTLTDRIGEVRNKMGHRLIERRELQEKKKALERRRGAAERAVSDIFAQTMDEEQLNSMTRVMDERWLYEQELARLDPLVARLHARLETAQAKADEAAAAAAALAVATGADGDVVVDGGGEEEEEEEEEDLLSRPLHYRRAVEPQLEKKKKKHAKN
eukprot:g1665.t1